MKENGLRRTYLTCFVVWCVLIFIGTIIPGKSIPLNDLKISDKIAHFVQYFIFSLLYYLLHKYRGVPLRKTRNSLLLMSVTLSIITEVIQLGIPNRSFSVYDMMANFCGFLPIVAYIAIREKSIEE